MAGFTQAACPAHLACSGRLVPRLSPAGRLQRHPRHRLYRPLLDAADVGLRVLNFGGGGDVGTSTIVGAMVPTIVAALRQAKREIETT